MFDIPAAGVPKAALPPKPNVPWFYTVELMPQPDGKILVELTGTSVDEEEPQLLNQDIARDHVATIDDALALIRAHVRVGSDSSSFPAVP